MALLIIILWEVRDMCIHVCNIYAINLDIFVAVVAMAPQAEAAKRCTVVLHKDGCQLYQCRKECYQKYKGTAVCVPTPFDIDQCNCIYNCN